MTIAAHPAITTAIKGVTAPRGSQRMSNGSELKSRGAMALRAAGYLPCPRLWLTAEQMALVQYMADQNAAEVNRIRAEANRTMTKEEEIERAWRAMKAGGANT